MEIKNCKLNINATLDGIDFIIQTQMESDSLEKRALIKLLAPQDVLDSHGLDIIKLFSPEFITNNYKEILDIIEDKSNFYTISISFPYSKTDTIHKFVNTEDIHSMFIELLSKCIKLNWDYNHIVEMREITGSLGEGYDFDNDSPLKLLEDMNNLDVDLFIKNVLDDVEVYFPFPDNWMMFNCFKCQSDVDDYIHCRAPGITFVFIEGRPDLNKLISRYTSPSLNKLFL